MPLPAAHQPVIFLTAICLAWMCLITVAHASESSSYLFEEVFAQDQQQVIRESSTYQFYETKTQNSALTATGDETSDIATEDSSTTTGASGGGHRGHGTNVQQVLEDSAPDVADDQANTAITFGATTITKNAPRPAVEGGG